MKKIILVIGIIIVIGGTLFSIQRFVYSPITANRPQTNILNTPSTVNQGANNVEVITLETEQVFDLVIAPVKKVIEGTTVNMLGYNGSVPGPTLRVKQGSKLTIRLKNNGNIPTTLHAHGVRMSNAFDGVPGMTQEEIKPGETFAYQLQFPDAGAFWYHPHVRTDYAVEAGLYGAIVVVPEDLDYWPKVDREETLMLDDIALDRQGILPFDREVADHTLMGRFGTVLLVNGEAKYELSAQRGEVIRFYLTNAANTRLLNFSLSGLKMKLIGADGGRFARETLVENVLLAPGERRIVDVFFEQAGVFPMLHTTPEKNYTLGQVSTVATSLPSTSAAQNFSTLRTLDQVADEMKTILTNSLNREPDKSVKLSLDMAEEMRSGMPHGMHLMGNGMPMSDADMGMGDDGDALEWEDTMPQMNARSTSRMMRWELIDTKTGKTNMDIDDWKFKQGSAVKIRFFNDPRSMHPMQHPIHFHGQRFVILATNGVSNTTPVWLDTTLIAKGDTVDILLEASNPGVWMAHCHILEHAESGMMLPFTVMKD